MEKTKEVLHTQGEWKFDGLECITCNGEVIADIRSCNHDGDEIENQVFNRSQSEAEANAELICKAVNEYDDLMREKRMRISYEEAHDKLLDERQRLIDLKNHIISMADDAYLSGHPEWNEIVNQAKNI